MGVVMTLGIRNRQGVILGHLLHPAVMSHVPRREFGKQLFSDAEKLKVGTAWGSFADPDYIKSGPLSPLKGRLGFAWAGAVLHVMTAAEVKAFAAHVHAMLAPTGVFFGVSLTGVFPLFACEGVCAASCLFWRTHAQDCFANKSCSGKKPLPAAE